MRTSLGVLGGMFDPVHNGHMEAARYAIRTLELDHLQLVPCHIPNHRGAAVGSAEDRLAMLQLAVDGEPGISVNPIELNQNRVSFSVDTLAILQKEAVSRTIVFVLGMDAFNGLPQWHQWRQLFNLCHFLVLARNDASVAATTASAVELAKRRVSSPQELFAASSGKIYVAENFRVDMSSTGVREAIRRKKDLTALLNTGVIEYIQQHNLFGAVR